MTKLDMELHWQGPLKVGAMPENEKEIKEKGLHCPGVYVYFQNYNENGVAIYAGKSNNLAKRIHEHLSGFLAFGYWLRDDNPQNYRKEDPKWNALGCFNELDKMLKISRKEVERLSFLYCPYLADCDPEIDLQGLRGIEPGGKIDRKDLISWLEASLIDDIKNRENNDQWVCDNGRTEPVGHINAKTHIADGKNFDNIISLIQYFLGRKQCEEPNP